MAICTAIATVALTGCREEELFDNGQRVEEGIPTRISLGYASQESTVEIRSAQETDYENRIENIYLFVFNSAGQRQPLLENTNGEERANSLFNSTKGLYPDESNMSSGKGRLEFVCGSLNDATIVAIANVTEGSTTTAYSVTPAELDKITTLSELQQYVMNMDNESISRGALFMMTGYAKDKDGNTAIDIAGNESGTGELNFSLKLERTDARIEVNVTSSPADPQWTEFNFRPSQWRVMQVPKQSLLLASATNPPADAQGSYFNTAFAEFETRDTGKGGFIFYMPENLKQPKGQITQAENATAEEKAAAYALREKWTTETFTDPTKPGQTVKNIAFENADPNSTYLVLTGELSYKDNGLPVTATTQYFIHLGYADQNPNDYLTRRNHRYIYTITVQGIDNILVEVEGGDPRPGHEGDVNYSQHEIYELDCHYDRCLLEIKPENIVTDEATPMTWSVSTPFSNGVYNPSNGNFTGVEDYRWIKFAINKLHGKQHGEYVKYPGDQEYSPTFVPNESTTNGQLPKLLDVNQLVEYLKIVKKREPDMNSLIPDNTDHICITSFVDEFIYVNDPTVPNASKDLTLWKRCVDQPDRELHIISEGKKYSADGNSSVTRSLYSFRQKAIRTIYNKDVANSAWGVESTMETERLEVGSVPSSASSSDNGRANTLAFLKQQSLTKWTQVVSTAERYKLQNGCENAFYACLLRNRDLNGDDNIDANEIRWYLAAINQLTDLYIGEYALDINSRLYPWDPKSGNYPPNNNNGVYWHYTSSTYDKNNKPFVVWAEEGPSKGNYNASSSANGQLYAYRCIRSLGIDITKDESPEPLITYSEDTDSYIFDLSRLNPKALRGYYVEGAGTYTVHNEKSEHNLPYRKFRVSKALYPEPKTESYWDWVIKWRWRNTNSWDYFQTNNPCLTDNYRVPNMREMLIFMSRIGSELTKEWEKYKNGHNIDNPHILSFTGFSMRNFRSYYDDDRKGYSYNSQDNTMGPGDNHGYTCGVRDEK